jgi:anthranilate phosphoribosyltransferase
LTNNTESAVSAENSFANFVRLVGRGPNVSRPLSADEAEEAMSIILNGEALPAQIGAFLALMRYRKETPAELSGFVCAARSSMTVPHDIAVDLDWPSYADRHRQLPYFVLAARLLATNGVRVLMHGINGTGTVTTPQALAAIGYGPSNNADDAARRLDERNFAYLPLVNFCALLQPLFDLRSVLGLRSPANTFARMLNPLGAHSVAQGVFHPTYLATHRDTEVLLNQPSLAVFKGGGGEVQRNPDKPCHVLGIRDCDPTDHEWPALTPRSGYKWRDEPLDPALISALWSGERNDPAPVAAVTGTTAIILHLLGKAETPEIAQDHAQRMWEGRNRSLS